MTFVPWEDALYRMARADEEHRWLNRTDRGAAPFVWEKVAENPNWIQENEEARRRRAEEDAAKRTKPPRPRFDMLSQSFSLTNRLAYGRQFGGQFSDT